MTPEPDRLAGMNVRELCEEVGYGSADSQIVAELERRIAQPATSAEAVAAAKRVDRFEKWLADPKPNWDPSFATAFNRHTDIKAIMGELLRLAGEAPATNGGT